jgi:hypothetical protein
LSWHINNSDLYTSFNFIRKLFRKTIKTNIKNSNTFCDPLHLWNSKSYNKSVEYNTKGIFPRNSMKTRCVGTTRMSPPWNNVVTTKYLAKFQSPRAIIRPKTIGPEWKVNLICNSSYHKYTHIPKIKSISPWIAKTRTVSELTEWYPPACNTMMFKLWNTGILAG